MNEGVAVGPNNDDTSVLIVEYRRSRETSRTKTVGIRSIVRGH